MIISDWLDSSISPKNVGRIACLILACVLIIDACLLQAQMVTIGHAAVPVGVARLLLFALVLAYSADSRFRLPHVLQLSWVLLAVYLCIDALNFTFIRNIELSGVIAGYWLYYPVILMIPLALKADIGIPERTTERFLFWVAIPIGLLALTQYITNTPILPTTSDDGSFRIGDNGIGGHVRAFSLFTYPGLLCNFSAIIASICIVRFRNIYKSIPLILMFGFCVAVAFTTVLRAGWLGFAWIVFATIYFKKSKGSVLDKILPVVPLVLAIGVVLYNLNGPLSHSAGAGDATSFITRLLAWRWYLSMITSGTTWSILTGLGLVQSLKPGEGVVTMGIDNVFLQFIIHVGVIGFFLFFIYFALIWIYLLSRARRTRSPLSIATAAIWSSIPLLGMFSLPIENMSLYVILLLMCREPSEDEQKEAEATEEKTLVAASPW